MWPVSARLPCLPVSACITIGREAACAQPLQREWVLGSRWYQSEPLLGAVAHTCADAYMVTTLLSGNADSPYRPPTPLPRLFTATSLLASS